MEEIIQGYDYENKLIQGGLWVQKQLPTPWGGVTKEEVNKEAEARKKVQF